jgi:predicted 3-demethylubiquinone-9 3-methyltransferase (glyoxalase superfamily)
VLTVEFMLAGQPFVGLNGESQFTFTEAVSFTIDCKDQAEVDRQWEALTAGEGSPGPCGWLKDRLWLSWQIVPKPLPQMLKSSDREAAGRTMKAMLKMSKIDIAALNGAYEGKPGA